MRGLSCVVVCARVRADNRVCQRVLHRVEQRAPARVVARVVICVVLRDELRVEQREVNSVLRCAGRRSIWCVQLCGEPRIMQREVIHGVKHGLQRDRVRVLNSESRRVPTPDYRCEDRRVLTYVLACVFAWVATSGL